MPRQIPCLRSDIAESNSGGHFRLLHMINAEPDIRRWTSGAEREKSRIYRARLISAIKVTE